jgi:hypothetical protein
MSRNLLTVLGPGKLEVGDLVEYVLKRRRAFGELDQHPAGQRAR